MNHVKNMQTCISYYRPVRHSLVLSTLDNVNALHYPCEPSFMLAPTQPPNTALYAHHIRYRVLPYGTTFLNTGIYLQQENASYPCHRNNSPFLKTETGAQIDWVWDCAVRNGGKRKFLILEWF